MKKTIVFTFVLALALAFVNADKPNPGHWADEIGNGTFTGDSTGAGTYVFQRPVFSMNSLMIGVGTSLMVGGVIESPFGSVQFTSPIQADFDITANAQICLGGVCRNTWPGAAGAGNWDRSGTFIYPSVLSDFVGIGTNAPQTPLHVAGDMTLDTADLKDCNVGEALKTDSNGKIVCLPDEGGAGADGDWMFNGVKIYHSGSNVGIGTNDPQAELHIVGDLRLDDLIGCTESSGGVLVVDGNGNVVCGTDDVGSGSGGTYTAGTGLDLNSDEFSVLPAFQMPQSCANGQIPEWNGGSWTCGNDDTGSGTSQWQTNALGIYYSSGNVGVGLTNPSAPLHVVGTVKIDDLVGCTAANSKKLVVNSNNEITCADDLNSGTGSSYWTKSGSEVSLQTTTDNVNIGNDLSASKLDVDGSAQMTGPLLVTGNIMGDIIDGWTRVQAPRVDSLIQTRSPEYCDENGLNCFTADQVGSGSGGSYTAGTGLDLNSDEFSVLPAYQMPQSCANGQIPEWNGATWACGNDDTGSGSSEWQTNANGIHYSAGYIGVGTSSPQEPLHVNGVVRLDGLVNCNDANTLKTDMQGNIICATDKTSGGSGDGDWTIDGANVYHDGGFVGVGNNAPLEPLHVTGNVRLDTLAGCSDPANSKLYVDANNNIVCGTDQTGESGSGYWDRTGSVVSLTTESDTVNIGADLSASKLDVDGVIWASGVITTNSNIMGQIIEGSTRVQSPTLQAFNVVKSPLYCNADESKCFTAKETLPPTCLDGQVAKWSGVSGGQWVCANDEGGSGSDTDWVEQSGNVYRTSGRVGVGHSAGSSLNADLDVDGTMWVRSSEESIFRHPTTNTYLFVRPRTYAGADAGYIGSYNAGGGWRNTVIGGGGSVIIGDTNAPNGKRLYVSGDVGASGTICDINGCIGDGSGTSVWDQNGNVVYYNDGNVGIGTDSPTGKLTVFDSSGQIAVAASSSLYAIYGQSSAGWAGYFQGQTHVTGRLGVGTTNPQRKLHVEGGAATGANTGLRVSSSQGYLDITTDNPSGYVRFQTDKPRYLIDKPVRLMGGPGDDGLLTSYVGDLHLGTAGAGQVHIRQATGELDVDNDLNVNGVIKNDAGDVIIQLG